MTLPIAETVKEATNQAEARTRATFIANRKEVLIKKWWEDFNADTDTRFEDLYLAWEIDAHFGILGKPYTIPSIVVCNDALNDQGCNWQRFNDFFQENLQRK